MARIKNNGKLPCPFCGGEAVLRVISSNDPDWDGCCDDDFDDEDIEAVETDSDQYKVECRRCCATFSSGRTFYTEQQAIDAWNRRAQKVGITSTEQATEMYELLKQLRGALASVPVLQVEIDKVLKKVRGGK